MLLIGGACLAIAGIVGPLTPPRYLALGLIGLVLLDTYLVFATTQVTSTSLTLQNTTLPTMTVVAGHASSLPGLQQVDLGNSSMGWLDFLAPALLGAVVGRRTRPRLLAAIVVTIAALAWGLLLKVTDELPATRAGAGRPRGDVEVLVAARPAPQRPAGRRRGLVSIKCLAPFIHATLRRHGRRHPHV